MPPTTPLPTRIPPSIRTPTAPSPHSTGLIPSSTHSSIGSTTPDSVYSDITHPSETPARRGLLWTPIKPHHADTENTSLGDTPRLRTKTKSERTKPTYVPGITAYPLTFPVHDDIYGYASDYGIITDLLDREHARVTALPSAVFDGINDLASRLNDAAMRRIEVLEARARMFLDARVPDPTFRPFTMDSEEVFAQELKRCADKFAERLERDARGTDRRRRAGVVRKVAEPVRKFTHEEQVVYERVVGWKGRLPLNMGEYDAWLGEWDAKLVGERMRRTALGRVVPAVSVSGSVPDGKKGKRKRDDLRIDVPAAEDRRPSAVNAEPTTTDPGSPVVVVVVDARPPKKQRTAAMRERAQYTTTPTSAGSASMVVESRSVVISNSVKRARNNSSKRREGVGGGRRLGFTVSKSSITSSCSSPDGGEGKVEYRDRQEARVGKEGEGGADVAMVMRIPTPETFVTAQSALIETNPTTHEINPSEPSTTVGISAYTTEYWAEMKRRRQAKISQRRNAPAEESEGGSSGVPSAGIVGAEGTMEGMQGLASVAPDVDRDDVEEGLDARDAEMFPSLSFPKDLLTSTPKIDRTAQPNDETTVMYSSPGRPVWECESAPLEQAVIARPEEPMQATQSSEPDAPAAVPAGTESMNDLTGLMDDLTSSRRARPDADVAVAAAATNKRSGWNVTSSPPADEASSAGMGASQRIQRMGQGVMEMASDLLGQDLVE